MLRENRLAFLILGLTLARSLYAPDQSLLSPEYRIEQRGQLEADKYTLGTAGYDLLAIARQAKPKEGANYRTIALAAEWNDQDIDFGIRHYSEEQLKAATVEFRGGLAYLNGRPLTTGLPFLNRLGVSPITDWIYVMDKNGKFFLRRAGEQWRHSSFTGGEVAAAGIIRFHRGKLVYIDNHSGHYAPSLFHLGQALAELQKQGVDVSAAHVGYVNDADRVVVVKPNGSKPDDYVRPSDQISIDRVNAIGKGVVEECRVKMRAFWFGR